MHFRKIVCKKVYLSPRSVEDALKYTEWLNNFETAQYVEQYVKVLSYEGECEFLSNQNIPGYNFAIVDNETDELIGAISLEHVNNINRTAELGIFIGEENHLSKGYGSEAITLLLDYGFNFLNLNSIMLRVYDYNIRAQKAYQKCGFKKFGVWKDSHYFGGKYGDIIYMSITKKEFSKK